MLIVFVISRCVTLIGLVLVSIVIILISSCSMMKSFILKLFTILLSVTIFILEEREKFFFFLLKMGLSFVEKFVSPFEVAKRVGNAAVATVDGNVMFFYRDKQPLAKLSITFEIKKQPLSNYPLHNYYEVVGVTNFLLESSEKIQNPSSFAWELLYFLENTQERHVAIYISLMTQYAGSDRKINITNTIPPYSNSDIHVSEKSFGWPEAERRVIKWIHDPAMIEYPNVNHNQPSVHIIKRSTYSILSIDSAPFKVVLTFSISDDKITPLKCEVNHPAVYTSAVGKNEFNREDPLFFRIIRCLEYLHDIEGSLGDRYHPDNFTAFPCVGYDPNLVLPEGGEPLYFYRQS